MTVCLYTKKIVRVQIFQTKVNRRSSLDFLFSIISMPIKTRQSEKISKILFLNLRKIRTPYIHLSLLLEKTQVRLLSHRVAVVHFNFRAGSTFPVPVCTVPHGHWFNKAGSQQN